MSGVAVAGRSCWSAVRPGCRQAGDAVLGLDGAMTVVVPGVHVEDAPGLALVPTSGHDREPRAAASRCPSRRAHSSAQSAGASAHSRCPRTRRPPRTNRCTPRPRREPRSAATRHARPTPRPRCGLVARLDARSNAQQPRHRARRARGTPTPRPRAGPPSRRARNRRRSGRSPVRSGTPATSNRPGEQPDPRRPPSRPPPP